ncbi:MAG: adenylosuccinate synthase [Planctomycetota bacterium]|jgi:adenylosuccinate synthase|nr:MAG: adenylosuccinate synthase [Planctomycetota bacterium]
MISCVVGLQWGDEAKGKIVDLIGDHHSVVVRYNGGANAGHTVVVKGVSYKLSLVPTGLVRPETLGLIGNGVVIHPGRLCDEIAGLEAKGLSIHNRLKISDRAHVIMPWHIEEERLREAASGKAAIGTTGRGIGPCYADKAGRQLAIRMIDLVSPDRLKARIEAVLPQKRQQLQALASGAEVNLPPLDQLLAEHLKFRQQLAPMVCDTTKLLHELHSQQKSILFEGAQGSLLDIDHGTFPFVTSSTSTVGGIGPGSGFPTRWINNTIGVVKAYTTRVGSGPFPTELDDGPEGIGERIRKIGREYGTVTGRPRRCGWFDAVAVRTTAAINGVDSISLMLLDVLSGLPELKLAVKYDSPSGNTDWFPSDAITLEACKPVYETLPGWSEDITACKRWEDLPANAKRYALRVAELAGKPLAWVSVGPGREQTFQQKN